MPFKNKKDTSEFDAADVARENLQRGYSKKMHVGADQEGGPIMTDVIDANFLEQRLRTEMIDYEMAIVEGKKIVAQIESAKDRFMRLGELADAVGTHYGEGSLKSFAKEIGIAACTLARARSVFRAWPKEAPAPKSYAVAQELQAHPNRLEIIRRNPDLTKREARQLRRRRDRETRSASDHLREETKRWFRNAVRRADEAIRDAGVANSEVEPELRQAMLEAVEPTLLPTLRDAAEALMRLADYLEQLTQEEEPREQVNFEAAE
jgi:hypothetical protein